MSWYTELGIRPDHLRLRAHEADELSHYSSATSDIEYLFPIGWQELEGIANRGDFDLVQHARSSGQKSGNASCRGPSSTACRATT